MSRQKPVGPAVKAAAQLIRSVYIAERRAREQAITGLPSKWNSHVIWDGGTHRGREYPSIWERIATFALQNKLDPAILVEAQFRGTKSISPEPNHLCSPKAVERYQLHSAAVEMEMPWQLRHQKQVCQFALSELFETTDWTRDQIIGSVLFDETLNMSALFRYCFADGQKIERVKDEYREQAVLQYMRHPKAYDFIWGTLLPKGFSKFARQTYLEMISQGEEGEDG